MPEFSDRELALHCARLVDQKGGEEVRVLHLPLGAQEFTYAVLVTANSDRLTNALVEEVWHFCKRHLVPRMPVEGETGWMLIDCYDVIVHALSSEKRAFYDLDHLWPLAREVAWAKESKALADPDKPAPAPRPAKGKAGTPAAAKAKEAVEEEVEVVEAVAAPAPKRRKAAPRKRAITPSDAAAAATAVVPEAASAVKPRRRRSPSTTASAPPARKPRKR